MNQKILTKKAYFQNFSWFQVQIFKLCMIMCVSLLCTRISVKNCSHFILKWFQPNSFGELCFLEESYGNIQKENFWKFWQRPLFNISEYAFKLPQWVIHIFPLMLEVAVQSPQCQCFCENWVCLKFPWTRDLLLLFSKKPIWNLGSKSWLWWY